MLRRAHRGLWISSAAGICGKRSRGLAAVEEDHGKAPGTTGLHGVEVIDKRAAG
jgi:hypothetical protein